MNSFWLSGVQHPGSPEIVLYSAWKKDGGVPKPPDAARPCSGAPETAPQMQRASSAIRGDEPSLKTARSLEIWRCASCAFGVLCFARKAKRREVSCHRAGNGAPRMGTGSKDI